MEAFVKYLFDAESALDIIINNAAQTIKHPLAFYQHLLDRERDVYDALSQSNINLIARNSNLPVLLEALPQYKNNLVNDTYFPVGKFDRDGQQLDKRPINSWKLKLEDITTREILEAQLVNITAPFILNGKLKPLLMQSNFDQRFIINVSAMEG
ncbi:MAG: SDR family NAD(P)-dependent oxidoreductase, partial [Pleurocapsa sp.]